MTPAQATMLELVRRHSGNIELGDLVMESSRAYWSNLAWRIADSTAGALLKRNWIALTGDIVFITETGRAALSHYEAHNSGY
jgi:hypothetical protein